jgi:hypothetical protein
VAAIAKTMEEQDEFLTDIRHRLQQAQAVQKHHYDRNHRNVTYRVGDWVLLHLRQRVAWSLPQTCSGKLKSRFYGPYRITELINDVAVRLGLPPRARLHDVFQVGFLKKFHGVPPDAPPPLPALHHGAIVPAPEHAVKMHLARGVRQVLVQWKRESAASVMWEDVEMFVAKYPDFQLEDEMSLEEGRDVMWGHTYRRRRDMRRATERVARAQDEATTSG